MIQVTRITGESFDFVTKQELPKALVLSNGIRDVSLHVDDETARIIVEMLLESEAASHTKGRGGNGATSPKPKEVYAPVYQDEPEPPYVPDALEQDLGPTMELGDEEPEDGLEPGEEYNDPSTGAGSL
jgi:hypothetical protein